MIQFDYPSGGISRKERRKYTFSNFRGVDTSVAKINVDPSRAVESTNFVDRNGVLHKRYGWEQVYQFDGPINGFWELFLDGVTYTICYAGTTFYLLSSTGWSELYTSDKLASRRTSCYVQGNKAYFIGCGDFLFFCRDDDFGQYSIIPVVDSEACFIPTTTAQIASDLLKETGVNKQYVRDSVNYLTGWRKNSIVPHIADSGSGKYPHYQLDGFPSIDYTIELTHKGRKHKFEPFCVSETIELNKHYTYASVLELTGKLLTDKDEGAPDIKFNAILKGDAGWVLRFYTAVGVYCGLRWIKEPQNLVLSDNTIECYTLYLLNESEERIGAYRRRYLKKDNEAPEGFRKINESEAEGLYNKLMPIRTKGRVMLDDLSNSPEQIFYVDIASSALVSTGSENIAKLYSSMTFECDDSEVEGRVSSQGELYFTRWDVDAQDENTVAVVKFYVDNNKSSPITQSEHSTLYGVNGESNRLFLASGDKNQGNLILFSEMNDFTYFPDDFTKVVGGNANEVKGFLRLANGSMAALKSFAQNEPTVFVFTGDYIDGYYDSERTEPYTLPRFSTSGVSTTQGILSPYACSNLADDSLFLSQNGVYALELSSGMESQRFAKERSLPINKLLKECNISELEDAVAVTHDNKYYLAVKHYAPTKDKKVESGKTYYIREKGAYKEAVSPTEERGMHGYYEREDFVYVADAHYSFKPDGAMADAPSYEWYPLNNIPVYNWFIVGEELYFGTEDGRICRFVENSYRDVKKTYFATQSDNDASIKQLSQKQVLAIQGYLDSNDDGDVDALVIAEDLDVEDGDTLEFLSGGLKHVVPVGYNEETGALIMETQSVIGKRFTVHRGKDKDGAFLGIQLTYEDEGGIVQFKNGEGDFTAVIERQSIVKAYRETPTFDFGMPDYLKSLESFTIVMNGVEGGEMNLQIATRNRLDQNEQVEGQTSFNMLDGIGRSSYNVSFQNSYTKSVAIRNFNYASMKISNETETDCSVASISLQYKYNTRSRGVR